jgi:hypothetical protein
MEGLGPKELLDKQFINLVTHINKALELDYRKIYVDIYKKIIVEKAILYYRSLGWIININYSPGEENEGDFSCSIYNLDFNYPEGFLEDYKGHAYCECTK